MDKLTLVLELIGTVAFAISGALVGLKKETDLLGVLLLGIITATGGGIFRDIILGTFPPAAFRNPLYVLTATITALAVFAIAAIQMKLGKQHIFSNYHSLLLLMDSIGLGIFTVMGVQTCWSMFGNNGFLCVFSGVITGVGGGLLRDMIVSVLPDIFSKHIYAVAAIVGAEVELIFLRLNMPQLGALCGIAVVLIIRLLAAHYEWDLPKLKGFGKDTDRHS